jgi:hypothetical protein
MVDAVSVTLFLSYPVDVIPISAMTPVSVIPMMGIIPVIRIVITVVRIVIGAIVTAGILAEAFVVSASEAIAVSLFVSILVTVGRTVTTGSTLVVARSFRIVTTSLASMVRPVFDAISITLLLSNLIDVITVTVSTVGILRLSRRTRDTGS